MSNVILPENVNDALHRMIELTQEMRHLVDMESAAMIAKDADMLKTAVARKDDLAATYEKAAQEFHARLEEFRGADPAQLEELVNLQGDIKAVAADLQVAYKNARQG